MMHKAWSSIEEVPHCFSRSYIKLQGHTALKIVDFDPNWAFSDCISSLKSLMVMKWCTKVKIALKRCPIVFQGHLKFQGHTAQKNRQIGRFRTVTQVWIHQWLHMMHKAWSGIKEVPYCFSRSSVKYQGHTAQKIDKLDPNWAFPDCNSSFNSPMATYDAQSLKWRKRGALLFFKVIRQLARSHT